MCPAINQILLAMGICRNFPRSLVLGPTSHMGIGIQHIFTTQAIRRLRNLIVHTALQTLSGDLFRASLEALIVEVGIGDDIKDYPYHQLSFLATKRLIKSTCWYLSKCQLCLSHDIKTHPTTGRGPTFNEDIL
jgi:hypothetical protein